MVRSAPEWRTGDAALTVVDELLTEAKQTVKSFVLPPRGDGAVINMPDEEVSTLERGVEIYGLDAAEVLVHPVGLEIAKHSIRMGENARLLQEVPFFLLIIDAPAVAVTLPHDDYERRQTVIMRNPGLVECFIRLFDVLWDQGIPLTADADDAPDRELESRLLTLLAQGHSDRAIARELGISERTLSRRITTLQQRHSARTRFQLGFQAARLMAEAGHQDVPTA